jgi:hypothetical protein
MKVIHIEELKRQLFDALKKQEDPRMAGNGNIFDEYPYSNPADRGLYERFMRGEKSGAVGPAIPISRKHPWSRPSRPVEIIPAETAGPTRTADKKMISY